LLLVEEVKETILEEAICLKIGETMVGVTQHKCVAIEGNYLSYLVAIPYLHH